MTLVTPYNGLCRSKNIPTVVGAVGRQRGTFQTFVDLPDPILCARSTTLKMNNDLNCCCLCGNQVEPGRKELTSAAKRDTGKSLFAGFCQSSEERAPCRRCAGREAGT